MFAEPDPAALSPLGPEEYEATVEDLAVVFWVRRKWILKFWAAVVFAALILAFAWPSLYRSTTKVMPPQQGPSGANAALAQLGALVSLGGATQKNPSDIFAATLQVDPVANSLITRFRLQEVYSEKRLSDTRKELRDRTEIAVSKEGIISITVEDRDPKRAADLANGYVEELSRLTQSLAFTEASRRRLFFESQIGKAKEDLLQAELALKKTQQSTGLIMPEGQAKAIIESISQLRGQIVAREARLQAVRMFATANNPERLRLEQELGSLRNQLNKMEGSQKQSPGNVLLPTGDVAEAGLEYVRRYRDVKYQESLFEALAKQFEMAKIDEAKDAPFIQVLQKAAEPDFRSWPKRGLIVALGAGLGLFLALLAAFVAERGERVWMIAERRQRWAARLRADYR